MLSTAPQSNQAYVDAIAWYHEFDFPDGSRARAHDPDVEGHRVLWQFIRRELDKIDFASKSVLDIGCWDGMWSFYAEKRGAARVLAADDASQNWGNGKGIALAKRLLGSRIDTRLDLSIYDLDDLHERFDVVLCLGVYYHLIDPFYAFAQVRHRCNPGGLVVFEGDVTTAMRPYTTQVDLRHLSLPIFLPSIEALNSMLSAAYFDVVSQELICPPHDRHDGRETLPPGLNRAITVCRPIDRNNPAHYYRAPFGLAAYDPRFG